ncbi:MAG: TetR family transcriptional regulator [Rhodospirillales bacterium 20-64-7]|nr:MAG: TetR family transcriptional regulator [Rhodospirillales bacterium 20-64-7]HQT76853.1 TetR/AcrR family transcriptional regulator [Rhodopila sp.]
MARPRAQDYAEKRESILRHAASLIARHGYTATSISMIAEACGISKALLYHYYPDKEALLFDILHAHLQHLVGRVEAVAATAPQGEQRLQAFGETLLDAYRDAHDQHQIQIANLPLLPQDRQAILRALERRIVDAVAASIRAALPDIAASASLMPLTMSWFGMLNWHYLWFREGRGLTRAECARMFSRLIVAGGYAAVSAA